MKFHTVIAGLEFDVLTQVADLVTTSLKDPYSALKERLISIYGESETKQIEKLLENTKLDTQRPSQLYRQMLQLAGSTFSKEVLRTLWLRNLPPRVQEILAATRQDDIEVLASVADKILDVEKPVELAASPSNTITTSTQTTSTDILEELKQLRQDITDLRLLVLSRSPQKQKPTTRLQDHRKLCYFHSRFRQKARKCRPHCSWNQVPPRNPGENVNQISTINIKPKSHQQSPLVEQSMGQTTVTAPEASIISANCPYANLQRNFPEICKSSPPAPAPAHNVVKRHSKSKGNPVARKACFSLQQLHDDIYRLQPVTKPKRTKKTFLSEKTCTFCRCSQVSWNEDHRRRTLPPQGSTWENKKNTKQEDCYRTKFEMLNNKKLQLRDSVT